MKISPQNHSKRLFLLVLGLLFFAGAAQAQWRSVTYSLQTGWNAIYLHGDASHDTIANLFPENENGEVTEVWAWNPDADQVQFTATPLAPSAGAVEWAVWRRSEGGDMRLAGQTAYLVKCSADVDVTLVQKAMPPRATWVRSGANLLGFPAKASPQPIFGAYFSAFPVAIVNSSIYKYIGGEFGTNNPFKLTNNSGEPLDRNQAYWFSADVVDNFYGPLEFTVSQPDGLVFGRTGSVVTVRVRNRTSATQAIILAEQSSLLDPVTSLTPADVPLTLLTVNPSTLLYEPSAIDSTPIPINPNSTIELRFAVDRADASMSGAAVATKFGSILRVTDSANLMDVYLPVTAEKGSLAGLWIGDIELTGVVSRVSNGATATATVVGGVITEIEVTGTGGFGYGAAPDVTIAVPAEGGTQATATATVENGSVTEFTITNGGSGYAVDAPSVAIASPPPLEGTSTPKAFPLRTLLHVADDGSNTTSLLSQVFIGQLAADPYPLGLTTKESLLKQDALATAQRFVAAHMPLDQVATSGSGGVDVPGTLVRTITVPFNDPSNPFVHQYHPDHDNKDRRFANLEAGDESYDITRTCTFTFTAAPPAGSAASVASWGSTIIGGTYTETITGIHKDPIEMSGSFELRRASEEGTLVITENL